MCWRCDPVNAEAEVKGLIGRIAIRCSTHRLTEFTAKRPYFSYNLPVRTVKCASGSAVLSVSFVASQWLIVLNRTIAEAPAWRRKSCGNYKQHALQRLEKLLDGLQVLFVVTVGSRVAAVLQAGWAASESVGDWFPQDGCHSREDSGVKPA